VPVVMVAQAGSNDAAASAMTRRIEELSL